MTDAAAAEWRPPTLAERALSLASTLIAAFAAAYAIAAGARAGWELAGREERR